MIKEWLVVHDYGMGGLWAVIRAESEAQITERYRDLTVYVERPKFISDLEYERIRRTSSYRIEDKPSGWLGLLAKERVHS